jgi:hypothetical protein
MQDETHSTLRVYMENNLTIPTKRSKCQLALYKVEDGYTRLLAL